MGSFIAGISLTCFAASYGVAWSLELAQLVRPNRTGRILAVGFVIAGLLAQTLYLGYRVVENAASPLSSSFDWCLVAAWLLVGAYLYLTWYYPRAALGLYMLPLALALVGAAYFADRTPFDTPGASRIWGAIHGIALLIGTLAVMAGFVAGIMYLAQARRLKRKLPPPRGIGLPSLEWLEKVNSRVIILSSLMVGVGFLAGIILNVVARPGATELSWSDPVIWSSALMLGWLLAAALFNAVYRPSRRGKKVAYLTVVSFVFLVFALCVLLLVDTGHVGQKRPQQAAREEVPNPKTEWVTGGVQCPRLRGHAWNCAPTGTSSSLPAGSSGHFVEPRCVPLALPVFGSFDLDTALAKPVAHGIVFNFRPNHQSHPRGHQLAGGRS